jgi:hypothetical protein
MLLLSGQRFMMGTRLNWPLLDKAAKRSKVSLAFHFTMQKHAVLNFGFQSMQTCTHIHIPSYLFIFSRLLSNFLSFVIFCEII